MSFTHIKIRHQVTGDIDTVTRNEYDELIARSTNWEVLEHVSGPVAGVPLTVASNMKIKAPDEKVKEA